MISKNKSLLIFRIVAILVSLFGLGYRLVIGPIQGDGWAQFWDTLGYFTVQSNLLVLFVFLSLLINQLRGTPEKAVPLKIRGAALLYIISGSVLFMVMFNHRMHETGISNFVLYINNFVTAILLFIDNALTIKPGSYKWTWLLLWLIYPILYLHFCIFESLVFEHFRYYIFNFNQYGLGFFMQITLLLLAIFIMIGGFIIFINKTYKSRPTKYETV